MHTVIHTEALAKTFHRKDEEILAVKGVDIDVAEGELVAFLGPNGAGKSTTLRMLTSLLAPTSGRAEVAGYDVATEGAYVRASLGYIGQGNGGGHSFRVLDELHNQGRFYHLPASVYRARAAELLEALELKGMEKRTVQSLSGGQRRRLDVAIGLMNTPKLLFLDEPTTGLDPHARANLWEHIMRLREEHGMTIVLTTHYLDEADSMSERVVVIDHGEVIADSTAERLKRDQADDVVTITLGRGADGAAGLAAAASAAALTSTSTASDDAGRPVLTLGSEDGPTALPPILAALASAAIPVQAASVKEASLDDVFLNLTGRSLREEAA